MSEVKGESSQCPYPIIQQPMANSMPQPQCSNAVNNQPPVMLAPVMAPVNAVNGNIFNAKFVHINLFKNRFCPTCLPTNIF